MTAFKYCIDPATVTELFSTLQFPNAEAQVLFLANTQFEEHCGQHREEIPNPIGQESWAEPCGATNASK